MTVRQHRMQLLITFGLLAAFGVVLLVHGIGNVRAADGLSGGALDAALDSRHETLFTLIGWFPALPVLVGVFWGAPLLAREFEQGTHLLAWTQSVSRRRWVLTKLGLLASLVTLSGLALGLMIDAWVATFDGSQFATRFKLAGVFMTSGVAAAGWWLFAFTLGAAGGALFRRLLPAIAVTIAVFFVALFGMVQVREDYAAPVRVVASEAEPLTTPDGDVMLVGSAWLDATGAELGAAAEPSGCTESPKYMECMAESGHRLVTYVHQADQYWRFQWTEAGLLLGAALVLGGVGYHRGTRASVR